MKRLLVIGLICAMCSTACSTAWVLTLDSIMSAAAPALIDILQIVALANGENVSATQVSKINNDAAAIRDLASEFARASAVAAPGVCSQLQAAIGAYQADEALVLSAAQVSDPNTEAKITLLSNLVEGTVDAILGVIPSCQLSHAARFEAAPPVSVKNFVATYNAILTAKTGNPAVDAMTEELMLHRHRKVVRTLSFRRLQ